MKSDNMTGNSVTDFPETPQCNSENGCQTREGSCRKRSTSEQVSVCLSNDKSISKCQTASQSVQNELPAAPQCDSGNGCQAGVDSCLRQCASEQVSGCLSNDKSVSEFQLASQNIPNEPAATTQCDSVNGYQAGEDSCLRQSASEQVSGCLANGKSISEFQSASQKIPNEPAATTQCDSGNGCQTGEGSCLKQSASEQVSGCLATDKSINNCQLASQNIQNKLDASPQCVSGNGCQTREGSCLKQSAAEQVSGCFYNDKSINEFQLTSLNVQNEPAVTTQCDSRNGCQTGKGSCLKQSASEQVSSFSAIDKTTKEFQPASQNIQNELAATPQCDSGNARQTGEGSCPEQSASEQDSGCLFNNKSINKFQPDSQNIQNDPVEVNAAIINILDKDQMQPVPAQVTMSTGNEQLDPRSGDVAKSSSFDCFERKPKKETHARAGHRKKLTSKSLKKKYMLRSLGSNDRALRSKTQEKTKAPESNTNLVNARNDGEKSSRGRKKKKKKSQGEGGADEFSRIKAHLKYLLNRVSYEQSLIDAYSGEGWKGNSMDKLKPEKELQRAKSEILRRKLKIRDLFQHLDTLCAEGKLPESLFDSEGEIDSEDIFCAKCGSKDLTTENDIILCDGSCDRGFHQFCLEPPLLTENIPPDNESWLCPGCDCKDDCIELLNESFGTSLSISDTWERIFPEAAAAAGNNVGLPSEDSDDDDDDYNPDIPEDKEMKRDESNSDESEYASASEKLDDQRKGDQYLGLPSDDSEDDDFDPNSPDLDKKVTEESSSSDFTSDSEDLEATIKDSMLSGQDEDPVSASSDVVKQFKGSGRQRCGKRQSLADELSSLLESDQGQEGPAPVSGKRQVERLDYKKLYDETYKNMESDTNDGDEDWTDTATASRRKKLSSKVTPASSNGKALREDHVQDKSPRTPKRNTSQNKVENTHDTPLEGSRKSSSSDIKPGSSTYKRLGEAVVQRLNKSFEENQYPNRATKENLAQELGLTFQQVDKWFGNTRWSFRHPSHTKAATNRNDASEQATCSQAENQESLVEDKGNCGEKSKSLSCRKRKCESDPEASDANFDVDSAAAQPQAGSSGAQKGQRGHKMRKRR